MFTIINSATGDIVGYTQNPRWIKLKESTGTFIPVKKEQDAQGIAYRNVAYNLQDRDGVGVPVTVYLIDADEGDILHTANTNAQEAATAVAQLEDALCEEDLTLEERLAAIEEALCELDLGGNVNE